MESDISKRGNTRVKADALGEANWPTLDTGSLQSSYRFGNSIIVELVRAHSDPDILRELIQNEYDAGGNTLQITFWRDGLQIQGNGTVIDSAGWARLSVMLGTGQVAGTETAIEPKLNGIGSKNVGLRSLFMYGNEVIIRSGGLWSYLSMQKGAPTRPEADPFSEKRQGVQIRVPYRTSPYKATAQLTLEPFTKDRETLALDAFAAHMSPSLIKLAEPSNKGRKRAAITSVEVLSHRCNRKLTWKQDAKEILNKDGLRIIRRRVRLSDSDLDIERPKTRILEEIEFQRTLTIPVELRGIPIPSYYRIPGGRLRLGLSMQIKGGKLDTNYRGLFYYPLGVPQGYTGNAISINAPFQMDTDRSHLIDPNSLRWNAWLLDEAAAMAIRLLTSHWFEQYREGAYLALLPTETASTPYFIERIKLSLETEACWPTRERAVGRKSGPTFVHAATLVLPDYPVLDGILSEERYLDAVIAKNPEIMKALDKQQKAKHFSINSLIRLRCAGLKDDNLATKLDKGKEADFHYVNFPEALKNTNQLELFGRALGLLERRLSGANKIDLKTAEVMLAADNSLQAASTLWVIDEAIANIVPVPASQRLHPILHKFKAIVRLCKPYKPKEWVIQMAQSVLEGKATEVELNALYNFVVATKGHFDRATRAILRKTPTLKDHKGSWAAPTAITLRKAPGASAFEAVLRFPDPEYEKDQDLAKAFGFRKSITGQDIVNYAQLISNNPSQAHGVEEAVNKYRKYLTNKEWVALRSVPFLTSSQGGFAAAESLYMRNFLTTACLGPNAPYVTGPRKALYAQLGCMEKPRSEGILSYIKDLRLQNAGPPNADTLYRGLVEAIATEKASMNPVWSQPTIWNGYGYYEPSELLIGQGPSPLFQIAIPQLKEISPERRSAFISLGVPTKPQSSHWLQVISWLHNQYGNPKRALPERDQQLLLRLYVAYLKANQPVNKESIGSLKFLLARNGHLYSINEAKARQFVLDDDPTIAAAIAKQDLPIAFAEIDIRQYSAIVDFYRDLGVPSLRDTRTFNKYSYDKELPTPKWIDLADQLNQLHSDLLSSAIDAFAVHNLRYYLKPTQSTESRLASIKELVFCEGLKISYFVGARLVDVAVDVYAEKDRILFSSVTGQDEFDELLSRGIAELYTENFAHQNHMADSVYRILTCSNVDELAKYLKRKGIPWTPPRQALVVTSDRLEGAATAQDERQVQVNNGLIPNKHEQVPLTSDQVSVIIENLTTSLEQRLLENVGADISGATNNSANQTTPKSSTEPKLYEPLPEIGAIDPIVIDPSGNWKPSNSSTDKSNLRGRRRRKNTRNLSDEERDDARQKEIGRYGEEIIYRQEVARVKSLGYPESRVVWQSQIDTESEYDILSVADDGSNLFIEVKATTGRHGRFRWPRAEFQKAARERDNYVLWRVYQVGDRNPILKSFRNPIDMLLSEALKLDFAVLTGEVEPSDISESE